MKNSVKTGSPRNIKYNIIVSFLFKRKPFHSFETAFYMDVCEGKNCFRKIIFNGKSIGEGRATAN